MAVLDNDKDRLAEIRAAVRGRLEADRLRLHPNKAHITPTRDGLNLLGYFVYPQRRLLRNDNGHRFARRLRALAANGFAAGCVQWSEITPRIQSWIGHAKHADTDGLRRKSLLPGRFQKGSGPKRRPARDPRRFLEQQTGDLRASNRNRNNADNRNNNIGFRLAQSARTAILPVRSRSVDGQIGRGSGHP